MGLHPETIVSWLSKKLDGRLAYSEDSYRTISSNPTISTKASNVLDTDVAGYLKKGAFREGGPVQGQYVSLYFAVPKSK